MKVDYLNPKQVIESGLPTPNFGTATVFASGLKDIHFAAELNEWTGFTESVTRFYRNKDLQKALEQCETLDADNNLASITKRSRHFAALEHTQIGDERDLQGRFLGNVVSRVISTVKSISDAEYVDSDIIKKLQDIPLTRNIDIGSAKTVPVPSRNRYEPDFVFKIPRSSTQVVQIVGELKFPKTCSMNTYWGDKRTMKRRSMRHIFGQIARDMREHGVRFGFVSTYEDTVFLKISKQTNGRYALYYSERISHLQEVIDVNPEGPLSQISVRCAMLYLIYRASNSDDTWSFEPRDIPEKLWIVESASTEKGDVAEPCDTDFIERWLPKDSTLETTPLSNLNPVKSPWSLSPSGYATDDSNDLDYIDNEESTDTPSRPRARPHNLRVSSSHEEAGIGSSSIAWSMGAVTGALPRLDDEEK